MRHGWPAFLLLASCAIWWPNAAPSSAPPALTVDRITSEPPLAGRLPDVSWTPDGRSLSFLQGTAIVVLDVESGERRTAFDFNQIPGEDRPGLEPAAIGRAAPVRYAWSPDGSALMLHHRGDLWTWRDRTLSRLTKTKSPIRDPQWAPDGRHVAFVRDHGVAVVSMDGTETALTEHGDPRMRRGDLDWVYPEELGIPSGFRWSPDGTRIAYLVLDESGVTEFPIVDWRERLGRVVPELYPKAGDANPVAGVAVVDLKGNKRWIDLGGDRDIYVPRLQWMPDGRLLIHRLNRAQTKLDLVAWDGKSTSVIYTETDEAWVELHDNLFFLKDGFLWTSERDGFNHLYHVGTTTRQITSGAWEVTRLLAADDQRAWIESTEAGARERHVVVVDLKTGARTRLTGAAGWHSARFSPTRRHFVDIHSDRATPPRLSICRADGSTAAQLEGDVPSTVSQYRPPVPEFVTVAGMDGLLLRPAGFDASKKHPVLIHTYGGPGSQLVADRWGGSTYLFHALLAAQGVVVFQLDGAGAGGRGRNRDHHLRLGEKELAAQLAGLEWLKGQPWCDGDRVAIWGWSYGGYMACYALTHSTAFKCAIAVAPVTDWRLYDTIYTERYLKLPSQNEGGYVKSSPVHDAAKLSGRLLLVHGTDDDNVHFQNSVVFAEKLIEARKPFDFMLYPGRSHGISGGGARPHLYAMMMEFILRNLR
jgi:dipeptidyl-peptidase-4